MIQFTYCYSYLAANIVQLRIYATQLERLAELLKGSAPNMFCNDGLCLPQSLSGTLYHCTQKNKPSEYIFLPKIVSQSHLSIGLLEKVEEGDADGSQEEHDHTQPMFCNRLANFSTLLISALIKYQHRPPPSERFGKVLMMVPLLVSAFTFLVNLSLLLKLATRPSSPISLSPPLTCRKFQTLGRRAAGGGFDFLDSKPRLVGAKY